MSILSCFSKNKSKKYYFVASVRDALEEVPASLKREKGLPDNYKYENHDRRCWGFFQSKDKAIQAVEENWTDLNEAGYYKYAVVEPHYEGLLNPVPGEEMWFRAKYILVGADGEKKRKVCDGYERCETPKWAEQTCGWAIS